MSGEKAVEGGKAEGYVCCACFASGSALYRGVVAIVAFVGSDPVCGLKRSVVKELFVTVFLLVQVILVSRFDREGEGCGMYQGSAEGRTRKGGNGGNRGPVY